MLTNAKPMKNSKALARIHDCGDCARCLIHEVLEMYPTEPKQRPKAPITYPDFEMSWRLP